jgi:hypothetical protein
VALLLAGYAWLHLRRQRRAAVQGR